MGLGDAVKALFTSSPKLKALMFFPNKEIRLLTVKPEQNTFTVGKSSYIVDEKAIYFFNKQPLLIYVQGTTSPVLISVDKSEASLRASEIKAVLETKAVEQILTAAGGDEKGMLFYAAVAAALFSLISALILSGVLKIGPFA